MTDDNIKKTNHGPGRTPLYYRNVGLFSDPFLDDRVNNIEKSFGTSSATYLNEFWNIDDFDPERFNLAFQTILNLWVELDEDPSKYCDNEAQLEKTWIQPVFEALGWTYEVQEKIEKRGKKQWPDYSLFSSKDAWKKSKSSNSMQKFYHALTVADAKAWDVSLDGKGYSNANPSFQIVTYMELTKKNWGILTNGRLWRLYSLNSDSKHTTYYEINLQKILATKDFQRFKYFFNFFRMEAFEDNPSIGDKCFLDFVFEDGQFYSKRIEDNLKSRAFRVIERLSQGFYEHNRANKDDVDQIYDHSLYYLFRLMFVLNCESRGLLEVNKQDDYYESSLRKKIGEIKEQYEQGKNWSNQSRTYNYINDLFILLRDGDSSIGVHGFGNEPFASGEQAFFEQNKLPDAVLNLALLDLSCDFDDDNNLQFIDYKILSPDHIGSLFEGLLEYKLKPKGKSVKLEQDNENRRDSGSYYTPELIVDFIIEKSICEQISEATPQEILEKTFCDIAMGSGHFLLGLVRYIEKKILSYQDENPTEKTNIENQDIRWHILHNCIYGVDLNPLAVELAKFSLWIYTAQKDDYLEPLSDQLKSGNSLISDDFDWGSNFQDIFDVSGGFDAIVGNPPYLTESRQNSELFREIKEKSDLSKHYEKNCDLFNLFIIRAIDLLKENGRLGYIVPQYLVSRTGCNNPRNYIADNGSIDNYIDFGKFNVFEEASGHHSIIFTFAKNRDAIETSGAFLSNNDLEQITSQVREIKNKKSKRAQLVSLVDDWIRRNSKNISILPYKQVETKRSTGQSKFLITSNRVGKVLAKIYKQFNVTLFHDDNISNGIQTYSDRVKLTKESKSDSGVFVLSKKEVKDLGLTSEEKRFLKRFFYPREISTYSYNVDRSTYQVLYIDKEAKEEITANIKAFPNLTAHLKGMKSFITSANKPYGIHRAREKRFFEGTTRILGPRKCMRPSFFMFDLKECYMDESVNSIIVDSDKKYLSLAFLNSKLAHFFLFNFKKQGTQLQIDKESLVELRLPSDFASAKYQKIVSTIERRAKAICESTGNVRNHEADIDNLIFDLFNLNDSDRVLINEFIDGILGEDLEEVVA